MLRICLSTLGDHFLYFPYGPVNFCAGPKPFAVFNACITPAGKMCMSVATEIIWNPWSAYRFACSPDVQKIPAFFPAALAALRTVEIAFSKLACILPSRIGCPMLLPRSKAGNRSQLLLHSECSRIFDPKSCFESDYARNKLEQEILDSPYTYVQQTEHQCRPQLRFHLSSRLLPAQDLGISHASSGKDKERPECLRRREDVVRDSINLSDLFEQLGQCRLYSLLSKCLGI
jgi:hypothetical protein